MIYLYVKTHNKTGLKYLGQTKQNPFKYKGSGLYWKLHLVKHGNDCSTEILKECLEMSDIRYWGTHYSTLWDIVTSEDWANLKPENGEGGCVKGTNKGRTHSVATKLKISEAKKGKSINRTASVSSETKKKVSDLLKGRKRSTTSVEKQKQTRTKLGPYLHSAASKEKMKKPKSDKAKENMRLNHTRPTAGFVWINDGTQNKFWKGDVCPDGWFSGMLQKPTPPSQKGKKWITDGVINKMSTSVPEGWKLGRTK